MPDDPQGRPRQTGAELFGDWVTLVALLGFVGYVGFATGSEFNVTPFYFIPVIAGTKRLGLLAGIVLSVVSAIIWSVSDHYSGHVYRNQLRPCGTRSPGWLRS